MAKPLILIAASGLAREVAAAVHEIGSHTVIGMLDDDPGLRGTTIAGIPVVGSTSDAADHPDADFVLCAGSGFSRAAIAQRLHGYAIAPERFPTVVHPSASVGHACRIGGGSVLLAGVVATADVEIGRHVVAMPHVVLTHDDVVHDFATLCAGVVVGGGVTVGAAAYVGMNSSIRQGLEIGIGSTLGMGAALVQDLPPGETWVGVPARPLQQPGRGRADSRSDALSFISTTR